MKKLISVIILAAVLTAALASVCFSANELDVIYDTAMSEDGSTLELTVTAVSAVGLQSGDLSVAYDESKYEFVSHKVLAPGDIMVAAGKAVTEDGLLTCSFITADDAITADMCDANGNLPLVRYTFNVLPASGQNVTAAAADTPQNNGADAQAQGENAAPAGDGEADPAGDFFMYVVSADVNGTKVQVSAKGAPELAAEHDTGGVTVPANDGKYVIENSKTDKNGLSWYVIVIIFVAVIAGAVGVAFAVRRKDSANGADDRKPEPAENDPAPEDSKDEQQ